MSTYMFRLNVLFLDLSGGYTGVSTVHGLHINKSFLCSLRQHISLCGNNTRNWNNTEKTGMAPVQR